MKKDVKVVRDPEDVKLALEDTRSDILSLLKVNDMTLSQLDESLDKDHSTIYRHIKKLEEAGYVEEIGEKKDHHIPKKVYSRTANVFLLNPNSIDKGEPADLLIDWEEKNAERILNLLEIMGYSIDREDEDELIEDLSRLFVDLKERVIDPIEEAEDEIKDISFPLLLRLELLMFLLEENEDEELRQRFEHFSSKISPK
ncbi:MAG: ArsR family transcriptional regulator [Candidatus Thermoplasmatota archaeon]|nr:ArsR family transcriptional regulator [Candidatus Thermoplasmatota archaeon]